MGTFELTRTMPGDVEHVFAAVGNLPAYGEYLPMTRIEHDRAPIGPGWSFTGYSGVGPLALIDRMQVTAWQPPMHFAIRKRGPILLGWAEIDLEPAPRDDGEPDDAAPWTIVRWRENIVVRPVRLGRAISPVTDRFNTWLFGRALDAMARRAAS